MPSPSDQEFLDFHKCLSTVQWFVCECLSGILSGGRNFSGRLEGIITKEDLHTYLHKEFYSLHHDNLEDQINSYHQTVLAAGLLSFGHLEVVDILIQALPEEQTPKWKGTCVVLADTALAWYLPIPSQFQPSPWGRHHLMCSRKAMEDWYNQHKDQLRWQPSTSKFVFL